MKKRSNFTPMKRFHEILDNYGLKLMEVGTNHLRVFFGNRKLFDYYPLRMKLFDYRQWQQLTYPSVMDGTDNGKRNWKASSTTLWYHSNKHRHYEQGKQTDARLGQHSRMGDFRIGVRHRGRIVSAE